MNEGISDFRFAVCNWSGASAGPSAELPFKICVMSNPKPDPDIPLPVSHRPVAECHTHGPSPGIVAQTLQMQARMGRILREPPIGSVSRLLHLLRQPAVKAPEIARYPGGHRWDSKSPSWISGKASGFRLNSASISSTKAESAGRGRGSWIMRSHAASPSNSGNNAGKDSASSRRSSAESVWIASRISCTVLTNIEYGPRGPLTSPHRRAPRPQPALVALITAPGARHVPARRPPRVAPAEALRYE